MKNGGTNLLPVCCVRAEPIYTAVIDSQAPSGCLQAPWLWPRSLGAEGPWSLAFTAPLSTLGPSALGGEPFLSGSPPETVKESRRFPRFRIPGFFSFLFFLRCLYLRASPFAISSSPPLFPVTRHTCPSSSSNEDGRGDAHADSRHLPRVGGRSPRPPEGGRALSLAPIDVTNWNSSSRQARRRARAPPKTQRGTQATARERASRRAAAPLARGRDGQVAFFLKTKNKAK